MTIIELARHLRATIERLAQENLSDEDALENVELFPTWDGYGHPYAVGDRIRYDGVLYSVLQAHNSQIDWTPNVTPSLYARVLIPDPDVVPEWEQPDSTNDDMTGDLVMHNNKKWRSLVDNNVWEPGAVGTSALWEEVIEEES